MTTNVYVYLSHPTNKVKFKYEKGDGETGDPIITEDDYALSNSGVSNEFASFTNETGQLIQSQTNELTSILSELETKIDATAKESSLSSIGGKNTEAEMQNAIIGLSDAEKQKFGKVTDIADIKTKVTDIFDSVFGSAVYDKANSIVNLFRGNNTSETAFASFDMKDENGSPSALNRFFSRIKRT